MSAGYDPPPPIFRFAVIAIAAGDKVDASH
jgi:hypothetical protein